MSLTTYQKSDICDIIVGTIDTIREWESDKQTAEDAIESWVNILDELGHTETANEYRKKS